MVKILWQQDLTKMDAIPFLFSIFLLSTMAANSQACEKSSCHRSELEIRFPFRLEDHQPESCGYPGFDLSCDATMQTILKLPSGEFSVQGIDYGTQEIWINDPKNCLPRLILSLNLSGSSFRGVYYHNYSFFKCSADYRLDSIACLSDDNYTVFATDSSRVINFLSPVCDLIKSVMVPAELPFYDPVWTSDLSSDLLLSWGAPRCGDCEMEGGRCGFRSNSSLEIGCFDVPKRGIILGSSSLWFFFPSFWCWILVMNENLGLFWWFDLVNLDFIWNKRQIDHAF